MAEKLSEEVKKSFVKKQPCFSGLFDSEAEVLASILMEVYFKKGDVIVKQGDPVDSIFIIVEGDCEVLVTVINGDELEIKNVATLSPGNAIGLSETGFYSLTGRRTATVIAKTNMTMLKLSVAAFNGFALSNHHVTEVMQSFSGSIVDKD